MCCSISDHCLLMRLLPCREGQGHWQQIATAGTSYYCAHVNRTNTVALQLLYNYESEQTRALRVWYDSNTIKASYLFPYFFFVPGYVPLTTMCPLSENSLLCLKNNNNKIPCHCHFIKSGCIVYVTAAG